MPFSQVYVCDFELDFVSREDTDALLKPISDLKMKNANLVTEFEEVVNTLEKTQKSEDVAQEQLRETKKAL